MKYPLLSKRWFRIALHMAVWIILFSLPFLMRPSIQEKTAEKNEHLGYILSNGIFVSFFYLNAYLLVPKLVSKRKYWSYLGIVVLAYLVILVLQCLLQVYVRHHEINLRTHIMFNFFLFLFFLASSMAFRMFSDQIVADQRAKDTENEHLKTELSFLRSQASPHFMFNVLNNMVALARKKSELLEPSLIKLSSLIRYTVYEANEEKVDLDKEIEYLKSYIDLQQQRFGKNVVFSIDLEHIDAHYQIEPMLLIPFVENAIKHGTGFIASPSIDIRLKAVNGKLDFKVKNRYNPDSQEIKDKTSGIGLANVKRRLDLLYQHQHQLSISRNDGWFTVSLQLTLH